jgi:hypothetical protein
MSEEPSGQTNDARKRLTHIPDNVETRDVLEKSIVHTFLNGYAYRR